MTEKNEKVKVLIRAMSPELFAELFAWMKMIKGTPGQIGGKDVVVAETKADDFALHVLDAIVTHMDEKRADFTPRVRLIASRDFKPYSDAFKTGRLYAFFEQAVKHQVERRALADLAVSLLYDDIMSWSKEPVTSRSLMKMIDRVPAVINKAFPGYAASGWLNLVVRHDKG